MPTGDHPATYRIFGAPLRYIQGPEALCESGAVAAAIGQRLLLVADTFVRALVGPALIESCRQAGVLSRHRHRHPQPVHGYVIKGKWRYLEHDWEATEEGYVYEAPGETHTLVVDPDTEEMSTLFQVNGAMIYVDPDGNCTGYDDVFTRIAKCRAHYAANGLGEGYVDQFIR
ncbi:MAG: cupin domain-containing protein [Limnohabitans sp.]